MLEPDRSQNFYREVITWKRLSHPNVLKLIGAAMGDKEYAMVTPLMTNGTIVDFLRENLRANPLKLARNVFRFARFLTESGNS